MTYADRRYQDDEPLALDSRRDRAPEPPPRRSGPAPVTLIVSLLLLGGVVGGAAWLYRDGARGPSGPPRVVGQSVGQVRTAAPVQAQEADPAAGLSIYKSDPDNVSAPAYVPPPEQPVERAAATPASTTAPAQAAASSTAKTADKPLTIDKIIADSDAKPAKAKVLAQTVKPADKAQRLTADAKPADKPQKLATAAKASDAAKPKADDKTGGPAVVQIGAFSTEDLARKAYQEAAAKSGASGKAMRLVPIDKNGQTLWRVAMTGFTNKESADAACGRLKAAGRPCFVR